MCLFFSTTSDDLTKLQQTALLSTSIHSIILSLPTQEDFDELHQSIEAISSNLRADSILANKTLGDGQSLMDTLDTLADTGRGHRASNIIIYMDDLDEFNRVALVVMSAMVQQVKSVEFDDFKDNIEIYSKGIPYTSVYAKKAIDHLIEYSDVVED